MLVAGPRAFDQGERRLRVNVRAFRRIGVVVRHRRLQPVEF
jgi:hypothetical protein